MSSGLYSGVSGLALGSGLYRNVSGLWGGASGLTAGFGGGSPYGGASLYLDFLAGAPLDNRITFTRGTNATLTDSTGKLTYAPSNLLTYSEQFDNAAWTKSNPGVAVLPAVTANAGVAPDGTMTADRIQFDCGNTGSAVNRSLTTTVPSQPSGVNYVGSVWVKAFDLANVGKTVRFAVDAFGSGVFTLTAEWQRVAINGLATATVGNFILETRGTFTTQTADVLVWGAQLEAVTYQTTPGTYVATTSTAYYGPRFDYDPVTLAPKGLLVEEARTNLLPYSSQFDDAAWTKSSASVTPNATVSPDGTTTADKLIPAAASIDGRAIQSFTGSIGATYTLSIYAKQAEFTNCRLYADDGATNTASVAYNLATGVVSTAAAIAGGNWTSVSSTATSVGNGWWRLTLTWTSTAVAPTRVAFWCRDTGTGTSGIYLFGAQLEAGAFATSYIPTVASTVTRSADVATMTGTNFSGWYNQSEGAFVVGYDQIAATVSQIKALVIASDGTGNNRVYGYIGNTGQPTLLVTNDGVTQANPNNAIIASGPATKTAFGYKLDDFAIVTAGGTAATDASGTVPSTTNRLDIGCFGAGTQANGHIREIAYFNTRLPDAQLQTLTAPALTATLSLDFTSGAYTVGF